MTHDDDDDSHDDDDDYDDDDDSHDDDDDDSHDDDDDDGDEGNQMLEAHDCWMVIITWQLCSGHDNE